jgi:hypothetical protein
MVMNVKSEHPKVSTAEIDTEQRTSMDGAF